MKLFPASLTIFFLTGCGDLLRPDPLRILTLNEFTHAEGLCPHSLPRQILVDMPEAYAGLGSERIALLADEREIQYVSGYKWDASAPWLVRNALIHALNNSGCFAGAAGDSLNTPYRLQVGVRRMHFRQTREEPPSAALLALELHMLDFSRQGRMLGRLLLEVTEEFNYTGSYSLGEAMEKALGKAARDAVLWCRTLLAEQAPPAY